MNVEKKVKDLLTLMLDNARPVENTLESMFDESRRKNLTRKDITLLADAVSALSTTHPHVYIPFDVILSAHPQMIMAAKPILKNGRFNFSFPVMNVARHLGSFEHSTKRRAEMALFSFMPREWVATYKIAKRWMEEETRNLKMRNYSKPCSVLRALIVSPFEKPGRLFFGHQKNDRINVTVDTVIPFFVRKALMVGSLKQCFYTSSIKDTLRLKKRYIFFFAINKTKQVEATAVVYHVASSEAPELLLNYLCSAKRCKGSGRFLMQILFQYARKHGYRKISLFSVPEAEEFYVKMGFKRRYVPWSSNNNDGGEYYIIL